jgi:hypothetical protein
MAREKHTLNEESTRARLGNTEVACGADYISPEFPTTDTFQYRIVIYKKGDHGFDTIDQVWISTNVAALRRLVKKHGGTDCPAMYRDVYAGNLKQHERAWGKGKVEITNDAYISDR